VYAETTAKQVFEDSRKSVYQIRVIDQASGDKFSIGSGFGIGPNGLIATNYHVVSSYVEEPEKYRLELVSEKDETSRLDLLVIDVIHDLAIVRSDYRNSAYLAIAKQGLKKGDRIYSMGNPHDLGMTIIEGNYNGLIRNSRYQKFLFSGSLNAGMSGGPTLNGNGEVIGINVSKGGEQLSFLVPGHHLAKLIDSAESGGQQDFNADITRALTEDQNQFFTALLNSSAKKKTLGELSVPGKLMDSLNCWGHLVDDEDIQYEAAHQHCKSDDNIYINQNLYAGDFAYSYEWITTDALNRFQFYEYVGERFRLSDLNNTRDEEQVSQFKCVTEFVEQVAGDWKVSTCLRAYKKHEGLFDVVMVMGSIVENNKAAIAKMSAISVSKPNALAFANRMLKEVEWIR